LLATARAPYSITLETSDSVVGVSMIYNIGICNGEYAPGVEFGYDQTASSIRNASVENNTVVGCYFGIYAAGPTSDQSNTFKNNILFATYPWFNGQIPIL